MEHEPQLDEEIVEKMDKIRALNLDLWKKQYIALVALGCKPASTFDLKATDIRLSELTNILNELGLSLAPFLEENVYKLQDGDPAAQGYVCDVVVATDDATAQAVKEKHSSRNEDKEFGLLMGYPKSAVEAFEHDGADELLPLAEDIKIQRELNIDTVGGFRLSKSNWQEEVKVLQNWRDALLKYAPDLLINEWA